MAKDHKKHAKADKKARRAERKQTAQSNKAVAPQATSESSADIGQDRIALGKLIAKYGVPSAEHAAAYALLLTDAQRATLGARTKAPGVLHDAVDVAAQLDVLFTNFTSVIESHYSRDRYQYLLSATGTLGDELAAQEGTRTGQGTTKTTRDDGEKASRKARNLLLAKMRGFAGKRETERDDLAGKLGSTNTAATMAASIASLVALARQWLSRSDSASRILAKSAGLTSEVVDAAAVAGAALSGAAADVTLAGRRGSTDSPTVNVAEGTVLNELEEANRCVGEAKEESPTVPLLRLGSSIRHVFERRDAASSNGGDGADAGGGASAPSGGASAPNGGASAPNGGSTAPGGGTTAPGDGPSAPGGDGLEQTTELRAKGRRRR